jgi:hypothetical protein
MFPSDGPGYSPVKSKRPSFGSRRQWVRAGTPS